MKRVSISLLVSVLLAIISIVMVLTTDYIVNIKHYIGFVLLLGSSILYFQKRDIYRYVFGITLVAGTVGLIDFFIMSFGFRFGFVFVNPLIALILLVFIVKNRRILFPIRDVERVPDENQIESFMHKFKDKSEVELGEIASAESSYVEEAQIAAERLLSQKSRT